MQKQQRKDRFEDIRKTLKKVTILSKNSMKVEAKEQKNRSRRQSLQLAVNNLQSEKLMRKFSDEDEEEEKSLVNSFDSKYKVLEKVGEGGNAMVFTCQYIQSGKVYAVKMVRMDEEHYLELKKNFLSIKMLRHVNIIRYHALYFDIDKHLAHLVMQYFPAQNLLQLQIKEESELKTIFTEVLNTIAYIHQRNVCHRDIKPQNILYDPMLKRLKLIDFGISKKTFQRGQRRDMLTNIGTYFYLAPQIVMGGGYDERVDLWSTGCTLYQLVTGVTPFENQYHSETILNIIKGQPSFDSEHWKNYSFFIKDLTCRLLKPRYERLSAKEALKHLWISQGSPGKIRKGSDIKQQVKFFRHDSGNLKVFRIEEEHVNIKHANSKQQGSERQISNEEHPRTLMKAKRLNLIQNRDFDLSDSESEQTSPQTAKRKISPE